MQKRYCLLEIRMRSDLTVPIQAMELIMAGLANMPMYFKWWQWPKLSLEVVRLKEVIYFYLRVPCQIKSFVKQLFYAHYEKVEVEEVKSYEFKEGMKRCGLKLKQVGEPLEIEFDLIKVLVSGLAELVGDGGYKILVKPKKGGFKCRVQFLIEKAEPKLHLYNLINALKEWGRVNGYKIKRRWNLFGHSCNLTPENLASLYHLPTQVIFGFKLNYVASNDLLSPNLAKVEKDDVILGETVFRDRSRQVPFKEIDRNRHFYVVGKTGMGKSTLLLNLIEADIRAGRGVALIDPHGDLVEEVLQRVPAERINDVIYFNPADYDNPVAFNVLESLNVESEVLVASGVISVFKKLYQHSWGPRLEYILRNTILSLLKCPQANLLMLSRLLSDDLFRQKLLPKIDDPVLQLFWQKEFNVMHNRMRSEAVAPIQNKVGQFLANPVLRNILGQSKNTLDLSFAMDRQKIVLVNLAKGLIGEDNSVLLGALLVTKFQLAAMERAKLDPSLRQNFYLYIDEFQNFVNDSFVTILAEARKYGLCLNLANQYLEQVPTDIMAAIVGNVGSLMSFQVGIKDAGYLGEQLGLDVLVDDLLMLPKYHAYLRLLNEGMPTSPFKVKTLAPSTALNSVAEVAKIKRVSRQRYNRKRVKVEQQIKRTLAV